MARVSLTRTYYLVATVVAVGCSTTGPVAPRTPSNLFSILTNGPAASQHRFVVYYTSLCSSRITARCRMLSVGCCCRCSVEVCAMMVFESTCDEVKIHVPTLAPRTDRITDARVKLVFSGLVQPQHKQQQQPLLPFQTIIQTTGLPLLTVRVAFLASPRSLLSSSTII